MDRFDLIKPHIKNKKVLDVGCVQHTASSERSGTWLHKQLLSEAKEVVGIDILAKEVEKLKQLGYDVRYADAENFDLGEKFDVIVAGELIEHLSNMGNFLECARKHLNEGVLIITTPNPFFINKFISMLLKEKEVYEVNKEHVGWYNERTLTQLLVRYKFKTIDFKHLQSDGTKAKFFRLWRYPPAFTAHTLIHIAKKM